MALACLTACPSDPSVEGAQSIEPSGVKSESVSAPAVTNDEPSILDDVEVMGAEEAAEAAEAAIDESNVLDALDQLEKEIGGGGGN